MTHFNVLGQKVTYLNERKRKEKEERERGKRKRKEKEERERGKSEEERERGLSLSLSLSLALSRAIHFLPFPLKFSISSHPGCQDATIKGTLSDMTVKDKKYNKIL